jgi:hypothetical protein
MSSTVTAFGTFVDLYAGVAQSDDRVLPEIRYAKKDGVHIAYQVVGEGDLDLLLVSAWFSHLDALGDPRLRALPTAFVLV